MLVTFWLPRGEFLSKEEIEQRKESININIKNIDINKGIQITTLKYEKDKNTTIFIDSLGFYYIDITKEIEEKEKYKEEIFRYIVEAFLPHKTKELIKNTFLNPKLICEEENLSQTNLSKEELSKEKLIQFIKEISLEYYSIDELIIDKIKEKFEDKEEKSYIKFTLSNPESYYGNFHSILNRNLEKLLQKSLFYTHGVEFEINEIYNLSIFDKGKIEELKNTLKIIASKNNQQINIEKLKENIIKKAIQDTIEEHTLLNFLSQTKKIYLTKIYEKINLANNLVDKIQSQILAVDRDFSQKNKECHLTTEEDLEIFIEDILQSLPKFNRIDTKIKNAYYIKVGNVTTETSIHSNETIGHTLFYQKWKASLNYFKSMAYELKEILSLYHQNKSIKELENIAYYENYKSDIDDIKNIQLKDESQSLMNEKEKRYFEYLVLAVTIAALAGEAPLIDKEIMDIIWPLPSNTNLLLKLLGLESHDFHSILSMSFRNFIQVFINLILYSSIAIGFYTLFYNILEKKKNKGYFYFDSTDYDKHEHRSSKPLRVYNKNTKKNTLAQISYNEIQSAYFLMKDLKNYILSKCYEDKIFKFPLFPSLLKHTDIRENYRISRNDKVTTHILFRYKITNLPLDKFLNIIKEDSFNPYYNALVKNKRESVENLIAQITYNIKDLKKIHLNLYIVYSFILKLETNEKAPMYEYTIVKDQYRIHYHLNRLPLHDVQHLQEKIAELVYIHFLARIKNFDYLNKERKCEKEN